jgi:hypothetical protein
MHIRYLMPIFGTQKRPKAFSVFGLSTARREQANLSNYSAAKSWAVVMHVALKTAACSIRFCHYL